MINLNESCGYSEDHVSVISQNISMSLDSMQIQR